MKIQLDTDNKTIKIESDVVLSKLIETLDKLLPNGEWKKFTLQTNTKIWGWYEPLIIGDYPNYYPWYVSHSPRFTAGIGGLATDSKSLQLSKGSYNIEA